MGEFIICEEFRWYCLDCKGHFSVEIIEENMKCPHCGCGYFNVEIWKEV